MNTINKRKEVLCKDKCSCGHFCKTASHDEEPIMTDETENEIVEQALDKIAKQLSLKSIKLSHSQGDGRLDSAKNEEEVLSEILNSRELSLYLDGKNLKIGTPNLNSGNNREWYDFSIESKDTTMNNLFYPVNIKVSAIDGAADNLNCKLGIFYAITGCIPKSVSLSNGAGWEKFSEITDKHMAKNKNKDYYFLVINKKNTSDVFWNSLKMLNSLVPNGNNLPFQCKWADNRVKVKRTYLEARDFLLSYLEKSVNLREKIGQSFRKYLKKYIGAKTDFVSDGSLFEEVDTQ